MANFIFPDATVYTALTLLGGLLALLGGFCIWLSYQHYKYILVKRPDEDFKTILRMLDKLEHIEKVNWHIARALKIEIAYQKESPGSASFCETSCSKNMVHLSTQKASKRPRVCDS